jgi:hypothetical protein
MSGQLGVLTSFGFFNHTGESTRLKDQDHVQPLTLERTFGRLGTNVHRPLAARSIEWRIFRLRATARLSWEASEFMHSATSNPVSIEIVR